MARLHFRFRVKREIRNMLRRSFVITILLSAFAASAQEVSKITFNEVHNKFSVESSLTDLQKDELWKEYKGKCVQWNGRLEYLDQGFFGGISAGFKHRNETFTYDVVTTACGTWGSTYHYWGDDSRLRLTVESKAIETVLESLRKIEEKNR